MNKISSPHFLKEIISDPSLCVWRGGLGELFPKTQIKVQFFLSDEPPRAYVQCPRLLEWKPASQGFGLSSEADGFFIDSHFPSDISPLFPISTPFLCLLVSFFSSQPATILKVFIFSCVFKLGFVHCPCSVTESKFVRDNLCTNTLHKAGI